MTDIPRVGEPTDEYRAVCVHALTPADPKCGRPATVHVLVDCAEYGTVALSSCPDHRSVAHAAGALVDEHPHRGVCGLPGTRWMYPPVSACAIDDSGVEPVLVGAAEAYR